MSEIKLFEVGTVVKERTSSTVVLEKQLQTTIEQNMETFFGVRFLKSEYMITSGRMDSIGIDENNSPVIFEYKRSTSENVINQGLFYLDWLLDHKADFKLLVIEKFGMEVANQIDWSVPCVICIANDFTRYDVHAVNQMQRNIKLVKYRKYGEDLLLFEHLNTPVAKPVTETSTISTTSSTYTQKTHLENTKIISTEQGEVASEIVKEFNSFWNSEYALDFETFYEIYKARYEIIKHQREEAKKDRIPSFEKYKLKPNSMQEEFIVNLRKIIEKGEKRALLISATGTGKTYASAFAMRELGFKRVLFLVHRAQLAKQAKKSFERVFNNSVSMGIVGDGKHEYGCDFVFAMVETLNRDQHLFQYEKDAFDCIILDDYVIIGLSQEAA